MNTYICSEDVAGMRVDATLAHAFSQYSRSFFQKLIDQGLVTHNGQVVKKAKDPVKAGDVLSFTLPRIERIYQDPERQEALSKLQVPLLFEHPHFYVIDKPAGISVHPPAHQNTSLTIVDWLMHREPSVRAVGEEDRPGIVHRIDKETSGLLILARTPYAHKVFNALFSERRIHKTYLALVTGHPPAKGDITVQIDRHPTLRTQMAAVTHSGRQAHTFFVAKEYYQQAALVQAHPTTGRTHQIRVHLKYIGHPILGDTVYGTKSPYIKRLALHAHRLIFTFDSEEFLIESPLPADMADAIALLKKGAVPAPSSDETVTDLQQDVEDLWPE